MRHTNKLKINVYVNHIYFIWKFIFYQNNVDLHQQNGICNKSLGANFLILKIQSNDQVVRKQLYCTCYRQ